MRSSTTLLPLLSALLLSSAQADLEGNQDYSNGMEAMRNQLPAVAAKRFTAALASAKLKDAEKVQVLLRLCEEAQIRARRGIEAEQTLQNPLIKEHAEHDFWMAQALIAQGRLQEAVALFEKVAATAQQELKSVSLMALLELYRSLNQPEKLADVLQQAMQVPELKVIASIERAETFYTEKKFKEARQVLQGIEPQLPAMKVAMAYLQAKLSLAEGDAEQAREAV